MRGLTAAGVIDKIGAISCVSGGTWFGTPYTFAPNSVSDAKLLGPLVAPAKTTLASLTTSSLPCLAGCMNLLKDETFAFVVGAQLLRAKAGRIPYDKIYSRSLNDVFLVPYGIGGTTTPFTLDQASLKAIKTNNPHITASFQMPKADRPFFIAGGTQIYQTNAPATATVRQVGLPGQIYRNIEYTPLYVGAPQIVQNGPASSIYGGGYVESFAFGSTSPKPLSQNLVSVSPGPFPFLLSDVVGSSSAAIEAYFDEYFPKCSGGFPQFEYWPVDQIGSLPANQYSFGDGGILENTGVVSLLRRGYQTIFAFVNSEHSIGSTDGCVYGIDGEISRLFGLIPDQNNGNTQSTQVFETSLFCDVAKGLAATKTAGTAPVYAGTFPVMSGNVFGIAPYSPRIFWIYNDWNQSWRAQLPQAIQALFSNPQNRLSNFPNYNTVRQSPLELMYLTPMQVNLLADMWAYTVSTGFQDPGSAFGTPIA
jgi:hypothetical protein